MRSALHLDLLKESEHMSTSPVRLRVMVPAFLLLTAAGMLLWWGMIATQYYVLVAEKRSVEAVIAEKQHSHQEMLKLMNGERVLETELAQLQYYRHSRICYAGFLKALGKAISPEMQLTSLVIVPPKPYNLRPDPKKPPLPGPLERSEKIALSLAGRTTGALPVNELLTQLQMGEFTNMVTTATIPRGAFRQEQVSGRDGKVAQQFLLFELNCTCQERKFE